MGFDLKVHPTEHFLLLSSAGDPSSQSTGQLLEQVHRSFYDSFARAGFSVRPQREKLVAVCFSSYGQLETYARVADRTEASWMDGYYSSRTNRIVMVRGGHGSASPRAAASAGNASVYGTFAQGSAGGLNFRTASHELAHQLAFNSGLQRRGVAYPFWVTEGLAANFEADSPGSLGLENKGSYHQARLAQAKAAGRLIPLEQFVAMTEVPSGRGQSVYESYGQAWGLFRYLLQYHREGLKRYMAESSQAFASQGSGARLRRFTNNFGPIDPLEKSFLRFIDGQAPNGRP